MNQVNALHQNIISRSMLLTYLDQCPENAAG